MNIKKIQAHVLVLIATILVAGSFIASEKLAGVISPFSLILLRFIISVIVLSPIIMMKKNWIKQVKTALPRAMIMSLFYTGYFIILFESLKTTSSLHTGTLYTLVPLLTALLYIVFFKEKITATQFFVYAIGIIGTCGIIFKGDLALLLSFSLNSGDKLFLLGLLFMALYSISMKLLYKKDDTLVLVFCTFIGGSVWIGILLLILDIPLEWNLIQGDLVFDMAYLIIAATLITTYLYQKAIIMIGPKSVMSYIYISPAAVAFLLFFTEGITITSSVIVAIIITTIATVILQISLNKKQVQLS